MLLKFQMVSSKWIWISDERGSIRLKPELASYLIIMIIIEVYDITTTNNKSE